MSDASQEKLAEKRARQALYEVTYYKRLGYFVAFVMFFGFFLWMALVPLKSSIVTDGKVVTKEVNKVVQHPTGGIIAKLKVKEGDLVEKGQVLVRLSDVQIRSQLDIVTRRWIEAMVNLDRLRSERDDKDKVAWSDEVLVLSKELDLTDYFVTQKGLFNARRQAIQNEQEVYQKRIAQTKQQRLGLEKIIASEQSRANSIQQDLQDWLKLYEKHVTDKVKVRDLQRQYNDLEGSLASRRADLDRLAQSILETQQMASQRAEEYIKDISEQLKNYQGQMIEASYQRKSLLDDLNRLDIVATESGRVVGLELTTEGALVEGRKTLMQIVPTVNEFLLISKVKPTDVDQVFVGQKAEIKFTAFRLNFVPVMYGEVLAIGADALTDDMDRKLYYRIKVSVDQSSVDELEKQGWQLLPGMPASVFLKTRERTLLNFILRPFQLLLMNAFNEDDGIKK